MSDDAPAGGQPELPLDPPYQIPVELVQRWVEIPEDAFIVAALRRRDMDSLFFAVRELQAAIIALDQVLVDVTAGRLEEANAALGRSRAAARASGDHNLRFMTGLMAGAKVVEPTDG